MIERRLMGTAIVGLVVFIALAIVLRHIINDRKQGKLCIGGCSGCPMSEGCGIKPPEINEELEKKKLI